MNGKRLFQNQDKRFEYDNIIYFINSEENTADVIGIVGNHQGIIIPRSIFYESKEYYVTSILTNAFKNIEIEFVEFPSDSKLQTICKSAFTESSIKSITIPSSVRSIGENAFYNCEQLEVIDIPDDSRLQTIAKNAFSFSKISSIKIPSELVELKEGWCSDTKNLTHIIISPKNPRYCYFDNKMIIGKTKIEQSNYDCLILCVRDIQQIEIPNFIEHICSFSFEDCKQLENIHFSDDSKLQSIGNDAFAFSTIKSIRIPSSVKSIGENAFFLCKRLKNIEIPNDSKIRKIDENAFAFSTIKSITIPSSITSIGEYSFFTVNSTLYY